MKYFAIFDRNVATIFHSQRKIGNISDMFLQYSVLCGLLIGVTFLYYKHRILESQNKNQIIKHAIRSFNDNHILNRTIKRLKTNRKKRLFICLFFIFFLFSDRARYDTTNFYSAHKIQHNIFYTHNTINANLSTRNNF